DGPTHQPVEHAMSLRAIPNLWVVRPADANETTAAWKLALERKEGPVAILLTRQAVPVLDSTAELASEGVAKGAYVVWDGAGDGAPPDLVMLATGSEVWVAVEVAKSLAQRSCKARVVSMPCWEAFEAQPEDYRARVLGPDNTRRLSVEAGVSLGWRRWTGDRGGSVSVDRFGAS